MSKKIILITGASSGIGKCAALRLAGPECLVVAASRSVETCNDDALGHNEHIVRCAMDVSDPVSVDRVFRFVDAQYGRLDGLVNCAGYVLPAGLMDTDDDNWEQTIRVNLTGTFLCTKHAVRLMKLHGGALVNIASTAGMTPRPGWSAYAAAKGGVIQFSTAIAEELKGYGIRVFVLCPGRTATPLRKILAPNEDPSTIMQPESVADIIALCLSTNVDVLEGQPIIVRQRF